MSRKRLECDVIITSVKISADVLNGVGQQRRMQSDGLQGLRGLASHGGLEFEQLDLGLIRQEINEY